MKNRCFWCQNTFDEYVRYHDEEWGVPIHDDRTFFEFLILEGAQAGLSWSTILKKRAGYKKAFSNFDVATVANYTPAAVEELAHDVSIVRNRLKIQSAIINAQRFMEVQEEFGDFDSYIWRFVEGNPILNHWKTMEEVPVTTAESDALSKDLKKKGFKFVGSTIIYAFMQAIGMVNDHTTDCFRHEELS